MPSVRIRGRSGMQGRGTAPGPSTFENYIMTGMQHGVDPFAAAAQTAGGVHDLNAMMGSSSYQSGAWQGPAQGLMARQIADALRALRQGGNANNSSVQIAMQAAALFSRHGALSPELEYTAGRVSSLAAQAGVGGALVPYRAPGLPVPFISPSRAFDMVGSGYSNSTDFSMQGQGQFASRGSLVPFGTIPSSRAVVPYREGAVSPYVSPHRGFTMVDERSNIVPLLSQIDVDIRALRMPNSWGSGGGVPPYGTPPPASAIPIFPFRPVGSPIGVAPGGPPPPPPGWMYRGGGPFGPPGPGPGGGGGGPGGGGGGGPGGGGGGGPGGGGRAWVVPVPRGPLTTFGNRLAMGGLAALGIEEALHVAEFVATLPQHIGSMEASALASATPYINLNRRSMGAARAMGASAYTVGGGGYDIMRSFFPGGYQTPDWMAAQGLGPESAERLARGFGVLPTDPTEYSRGIPEALARMQFSPGLSNLDVSASVGQAARYGIAKPTGTSISAYGQDLNFILENAVARGMDRATILRSIDESVAMSARSGAAGVGVNGNADFLMRFSNLPGGRTGEVGLQAMSGLQGATDMIGKDPLRTMMAANMVTKINSPSDLQGLLGAEGYNAVTSTPEGKEAMRLFFLSKQKGDYYTASGWLQQMIAGNAGAQEKVFSQSEFYKGIPEQARPLVAGAVQGRPGMGVLSTSINPQGLPGTNGGQPMLDPGGAEMGGSTFFTGAFGKIRSTLQMFGVDGEVLDPAAAQIQKGEYASGLRRMGIREDLIPTVIREAANQNVNPLFLGGIMMHESRGGSHQGAIVGGAGGIWQRRGEVPSLSDVNVMQITPDARMGPQPTTAEESIRQGAIVARNALIKSHQNMRGAFDVYALGTAPGVHVSERDWSIVNSAMVAGGASGNVNGDTYSTPSSVEQAGMAGSATSFHELNAIIPGVNTGLANLTSAANRAAAALSRIAAPNQSHMLPGVTGVP